MISELKRYGNVKENVDLSNYNTYKIHTMTKYLVEPFSVADLELLIKFLKSHGVKYFILGNGSNIILPSDNYDGVIIRLCNLNKVFINGNDVYCEAGVMMPKLVSETVNNSLKGLEWASGIPGTLGASIVGNAGAYLADICSFVTDIKVLENDEIKVINISDIDYSYRNTSLKGNKNLIILSANLKLEDGNKLESLALIADRTKRRMDSQPLEYPSAGSTFRNPEGDYAGRLIEACDLKGKKMGGAMVSSKHANFIINYDNATSDDIINLIKLVHDTVLEKENVDLILEQEIINWS